MAQDKGIGQMPESMRSAFETSVSQARTMFEQMIAASERAMAGFEGQARAFQSDAMEMNRKVMAIAQQNVDSALSLAERLARAKDVQEMLQAHQAFAREQMDRLGEQTRELTEIARSSAGRMTEGMKEAGSGPAKRGK